MSVFRKFFFVFELMARSIPLSLREIKEFESIGFFSKVEIIKYNFFLSKGDHNSVRCLAGKNIKFKNNNKFYYLAKSYYLYADYENALLCIKKFHQNNGSHADSIYLLSDIYIAQNNFDAAWECLESLAVVSSRLKTYLYFSNLVKNKKDYLRMESNILKAVKRGLIPSYNKNISEYMAQAALRVKDYNKAKEIWRDLIFREKKAKRCINRIKFKKNYTQLSAVALKDLKLKLDIYGIEFFLISGTLLGCIREGAILPHDKDIDVGIWDNVPFEKLLVALRRSGLFYIHAQRSSTLLRVKHVNGTDIDIFYHYVDGDICWHGGVKAKWINTKFDLIEYNFLGSVYLVPKNYRLYLKENYGDWAEKIIDFDNIYDTPNSIDFNNSELVIHNYKSLLKSLCKTDNRNVVVLKKRLEDLGEDFVNVL